MFEQFDKGVRFIDLRPYYTNLAIRLVHGPSTKFWSVARTHGSARPAVLDPNTLLEVIFWGIYHWRNGHPTETILVSVKVENGDNTAELQ